MPVASQCYIRRRTLEDFEQLAISEKIIPYQLDKHTLRIFVMLHFDFYGIFYQVFSYFRDSSQPYC